MPYDSKSHVRKIYDELPSKVSTVVQRKGKDTIMWKIKVNVNVRGSERRAL